jgi:hypothetical protein
MSANHRVASVMIARVSGAVPGLRRSIPLRSCCATPGTQWGGPYGNSLLCNTIMVPCPPSTVAAKV